MKLFGEKTYYQILGVAKDANQKEIRKAFRELAKKFHPDLGKQKGKDYSKIFEQINLAYSVLSNPKKRKEYDSQLESKKNRPNILEIFNFKEVKKIIKSTISLENILKAKVSKPYYSEELSKLSVEELLDRIIFSRNIEVQKYAVKLLIEKKKLYPIRDLLRLLYSNIHEEVKICIIEGLKTKSLPKKSKNIIKEIYELEKNPKVKEAIATLI
jgi:curved DNA-binding protein CbpA